MPADPPDPLLERLNLRSQIGDKPTLDL